MTPPDFAKIASALSASNITSADIRAALISTWNAAIDSAADRVLETAPTTYCERMADVVRAKKLPTGA